MKTWKHFKALSKNARVFSYLLKLNSQILVISVEKVEEYLIKFDKYPLFYASELPVGSDGEKIIYFAYKYSGLGQNQPKESWQAL